MASIDELEAALQAQWEPETATVYADALIARGDPRGELIALELHAERHGATPELVARQRAALTAWLGDTWSVHDVRRGCVDGFLIDDPVMEARFVTPARPYLWSVKVHGGAAQMPALLERLASQPLPWLRRLTIVQADGRGKVPPAVMHALIEATPHLEELVLEGAEILRSPGHPNVRTLRMDGREAIVVGASAMPHVTEIDLAFERYGGPPRSEYAPLLNPRLFPALERLDISRNEYKYPPTNVDNVPIFPFLDAIEAFERIRWLRLPALRTEEDARDALALIGRYPHLEITVARMFEPLLQDAGVPRLHVPAPRPWPPPEHMSGRNALCITPPGDEIALASCVELLEVEYDAMPEDGRAAWLALWRFLDGLAWEDAAGNTVELPYDAAALLRALDALGDRDDRCQRIAAALRARDLPPGATVQIQRYWGW